MKTISTLCGIAATCACLITPFSGLAGDIDVPADYATIQAAVDAAFSGDTIHIAPGVYQEQVKFTGKNLTLTGQPGAIVRAFPGMTFPSGSTVWRPLLFIDQSSSTTVRGLTFEGDQLADQQDPGGNGLGGVYFISSGGTIENCRFTGFRESVPGTNGAFAIRMWNDNPGSPLYNARIIDNVIEDSYVGMSVVGAPTLSYNMIISNNTVHGIGPNTTGGDNGMRGIGIGRGVTGSVVDNIVSGFSYQDNGVVIPQYPFAWGIIAEYGSPGTFTTLEPVRFENNTLSNNNLHMILLKADDHEVINNRFEGTGPSTRMAGVWLSGNNVKVQGNTFDGMETGIRVGGNDPDFGTALGIAYNAAVSDNRFCDVVTNVEVQPMATATVTGSLMCPFPPPVLDITKSVLLSWPEIEEGFSVERALDSEGPWTPVDATQFLQDGRHSVAVPTASDQELFRLVAP